MAEIVEPVEHAAAEAEIKYDETLMAYELLDDPISNIPEIKYRPALQGDP